MIKIEISQIFLGLAIFLCLSACSDEVDRRDELGIEVDENGRFELVPVEGGKKESTVREDSLHNGNATGIDSTAAPAVINPEKGERHPVEVVPAEAEFATGQAVVFDPDGAYTAQIGGYRNAQKASRLVRELNNAGYPAYAIARPSNREMRVRIGYFKTQSDAARFGAIFQADHDMEYWVDKRENE